MKICKTCGKFILDDENGDLAFTVNPGLPDKEYVECESCHDHAIDRSKIIQCEACGEWFSNDVLECLWRYEWSLQTERPGSSALPVMILAPLKRKA